jgi:hypothetical protein
MPRQAMQGEQNLLAQSGLRRMCESLVPFRKARMDSVACQSYPPQAHAILEIAPSKGTLCARFGQHGPERMSLVGPLAVVAFLCAW